MQKNKQTLHRVDFVPIYYQPSLSPSILLTPNTAPYLNVFGATQPLQAALNDVVPVDVFDERDDIALKSVNGMVHLLLLREALKQLLHRTRSVHAQRYGHQVPGHLEAERWTGMKRSWLSRMLVISWYR